MKNFGYCIWLTSLQKENNIWNHYTNGFQSHITLKYNLNLESATNFIKLLEKEKKKEYKIKLSDKLYYCADEKDNFYCLYKTASIVEDEIPEWFPLDAHVSFYYSYYPISEEVKNNLQKIIKENVQTFNHFQIKLCNDHFLLW